MKRVHGYRRVGVVAAVLACAAIVLVALPLASLGQGCAMCATYLSAAGEQRANGFRVSILFLMAMPFVVVGSAGGWILWMYRRSRRHASLQLLRPEREGAR